jgi:hypothetical protein
VDDGAIDGAIVVGEAEQATMADQRHRASSRLAKRIMSDVTLVWLRKCCVRQIVV